MPGSIITHARMWWEFDCYSLIFDILQVCHAGIRIANCVMYTQGAKKVIFTACHLGKLRLAYMYTF